jgi:hypothetical protein
MPRILRNLRIDEVSLVDRGAGKGCAIVIRKRADAEDVGDTGGERLRRAKRAGRFTDILLGKKSAYEASLEREAELQAAVRKTGESMTREELQAERDAQLRAVVKAHGITALAKGVLAGLTSIDEHELTALATEHAQRAYPDLSPAQAFEKIYASDATLREAISIAKEAASLSPVAIDGVNPDDVQAATEALNCLVAEQRARFP